MYKIKSTTIIDHSKRKGLKHSLRGLITILVDLTMENNTYNIQFLPDASQNYNLKFSREYPGSKEFIEACKKTGKNPDSIANNIKETSCLQAQWQRYASNI